MLTILKNENNTIELRKKYTLENCIEFTKRTIDMIIMGIEDNGITLNEYESRKNKIEILSMFLKKCGIGDIAAKEYVKDYIQDLVTQEYGLNEKNIDYVLNFSQPNLLTTQEKFDIILNSYKNNYAGSGLKELLKKYKLDKLREYKGKKKFVVTSEDIEKIFIEENISLNFIDKLSLVTQRIYQSYKGLGVIDEIRDQNINGLSIGVSGLPESFAAFTNLDDYIKGIITDDKKAYESVWLYFQGKEIYLEFMSFGNFNELERVCNIIYKLNNPGQLSKSRPVIVNDMADGSRVTVMRPPFAESWLCIIRKFDKRGKLKDLIKGKNSDIVIKLIEFIAKACTISFSGQQGVGKTTLLVAAMQEIYPFLTLRISESFFETHLRKLLPENNIITIRETEDISGENGLNVLKKTNGAVTIIGEAAEDIQVAYIFKVAMVASLYTMFTDHSVDFDSLIKSKRNAAISVGAFKDEKTAEEQIISILDHDIHLEMTAEGDRYIERITECIPKENKETGKMYTAVNLIEYDLDNEAYVIKNSLDESKIKKIEKRLLKEDREEFRKFIKENFSKVSEGARV